MTLHPRDNYNPVISCIGIEQSSCGPEVLGIHAWEVAIYNAWLEINLGALGANLKEVKRFVGENVEICAVVKADSYGHGSVESSKVFLGSGASSLGVATCDEGIELRNNGINAPISVLALSPTERFPEIIDASFFQTIASLETAMELSKVASQMKKKASVHVKVDSGMARIGFKPNSDSIRQIMEISRLPFISIVGVSSHFATSESKDKSFTYEQHKRYMYVADALRKKGLSFKAHISNSGGILSFPEMNMDIVRPGAILYGLDPTEEKCSISLQPAMTLKARVCHLAYVGKGESVGYDRTFVTQRKTLVGTVVIGYADGYASSLSNKSRVLAGDGYAPVIGRVCMDQIMLDLTEIKDIKEGSEVVLLGNKGGNEITVKELSGLSGLATRELLCKLGSSKRIPKIYVNSAPRSKSE